MNLPEHPSKGVRRRPRDCYAPPAMAPLSIPLLVALGLVLGLFPAAPGSGQEAGALAGHWELDPAESDDPAEAVRRAAEEAMERGGRRRGRSGRGVPPDGFLRGGGASLAALPELLEIEWSGGELRLVLEDRVQILYLDGEEHLREDGRGGWITTVAEARGGIVRVEEKRRLPLGEIEARRTLQATGEVLVVRTELNLPWGGSPVLLRTVYRRLPEP